MAFDHLAIDRDLAAWTDAQFVAGRHVAKRDLRVATVRGDNTGFFWREIEKLAQGGTGLLARPKFKNLAEQNQYRDCRRRLEIDRHDAMSIAERGRKLAWRDRRNHAVQPGSTGAERD